MSAEEMTMLTWAKRRKIAVSVSQKHHLWSFKYSKHNAQWWPVTGKLIFNGKHRKAVYISDVDDVIRYIEEQWNRLWAT